MLWVPWVDLPRNEDIDQDVTYGINGGLSGDLEVGYYVIVVYLETWRGNSGGLALLYGSECLGF